MVRHRGKRNGYIGSRCVVEITCTLSARPEQCFIFSVQTNKGTMENREAIITTAVIMLITIAMTIN